MEILLIFLEKSQSFVNKHELSATHNSWKLLTIIGYLVYGLIRLSPKYFFDRKLGIFRILLGLMQWEHCYTISKAVKSSEVQSGFAAFGQQKVQRNEPIYCQAKIMDTLLRSLFTVLLFTLVVVHSDRILCLWVGYGGKETEIRVCRHVSAVWFQVPLARCHAVCRSAYAGEGRDY